MTQAPVLVVVDHHDGVPSQPSTEVLTAARTLADGAPVAAVWLGSEGPGEAAILKLPAHTTGLGQPVDHGLMLGMSIDR